MHFTLEETNTLPFKSYRKISSFDYLVRTQGLEGARIVDRSIFEQIYERVL